MKLSVITRTKILKLIMYVIICDIYGNFNDNRCSFIILTHFTYNNFHDFSFREDTEKNITVMNKSSFTFMRLHQKIDDCYEKKMEKRNFSVVVDIID